MSATWTTRFVSDPAVDRAPDQFGPEAGGHDYAETRSQAPRTPDSAHATHTAPSPFAPPAWPAHSDPSAISGEQAIRGPAQAIHWPADPPTSPDEPQRTSAGDVGSPGEVVRTVGLDSHLRISGDPLSLDEVPGALERLKQVRHEALAPLDRVVVRGSTATLTHRVPLRSTPLVDVLDDGEPLSDAEALQVAGPVARALDALHDAGLAHGDLSSSQVVLDELARPILIGAGHEWTDIQRATGVEADRLTFARWVGALLDVSPAPLKAVSARRPAARCSDVVAALQAPGRGAGDALAPWPEGPVPIPAQAPAQDGSAGPAPPDPSSSAGAASESPSAPWAGTQGNGPWAGAHAAAQRPIHQPFGASSTSVAPWGIPDPHARVDGLPDPWASAWASEQVTSGGLAPADVREPGLRDLLRDRRSQIGLLAAVVIVVLALILMLTGAL